MLTSAAHTKRFLGGNPSGRRTSALTGKERRNERNSICRLPGAGAVYCAFVLLSNRVSLSLLKNPDLRCQRRDVKSNQSECVPSGHLHEVQYELELGALTEERDW
jgi:hypothetical protein